METEGSGSAAQESMGNRQETPFRVTLLIPKSSLIVSLVELPGTYEYTYV